MKSIFSSIIIRTKNEEKWLPRCLSMVFAQEYKNFEVVIVDNESTDNTVKIARSWNVDTIVNVSDYSPGKALNLGIKNSSGENLVFLSAHCVPVDEYWLSKLINSLESNDKVFAVYGRQIPLPDSSIENSRDLLSVFRTESRMQSKDNFFHNANSAIKRSAWNIIPFDEKIKSLEDQLWASEQFKVRKSLGDIYYNSEATVYHHDGLHYHESEDRSQRVVQSLRELNVTDLDKLPQFSKLRNKDWFTIAIFDDNSNLNALDVCAENYRNFLKNFSGILKCRNILVSSSNFFKKVSTNLDRDLLDSITLIERTSYNHGIENNLDLLEVIKNITVSIPDSFESYPEAIFFFNPQYLPTSAKHILNLLEIFGSGDYDLVLLGSKIQGLTWVRQASGRYTPSEFSLEPHKERSFVLETFLGAGCVMLPSAIVRKNILESHKVQIIQVPHSINRNKG
jgi:glycosyltransferase involved in cell wall biosynthesis